MASRKLAAALLSATLVLAACGGNGDDPSPKKSAEPVKPKATSAAPAPDALVRAHCAPDAQGEGVWSAGGVLKNRSKRARSFDVIIQVGPADGQESTAVTKRVKDVAPGKTAEFAVTAVPAKTPAGPCHIQVRAAK